MLLISFPPLLPSHPPPTRFVPACILGGVFFSSFEQISSNEEEVEKKESSSSRQAIILLFGRTPKKIWHFPYGIWGSGRRSQLSGRRRRRRRSRGESKEAPVSFFPPPPLIRPSCAHDPNSPKERERERERGRERESRFPFVRQHFQVRFVLLL